MKVRLQWVGLVALLISVVAAARGPAMGRFDHAGHERPLAREGLGCVACHPVGQGDEPLAVPARACHYCHTDAESKQRRAPSRCETCHDDVLPPPDHIVGWLDDHGAVARTKGCSDCHGAGFCIDCHERRDSAQRRVHDRGWLGVHGIAVMADPAACGSCHGHDYCSSCHAGGGR